MTSRDPRPDLTQGRLALGVEPQAGIPVLRQPLRGHRHAGIAFGQGSSAHMAPRPTAPHPPSLVADSALYSAETLPKLAQPSLTWIPRVPAPWHAAQAVLTQAAPPTMAPLPEG